MKQRTWLFLLAVLVGFGVIAAGVYVASGGLQTTLEFTAVDAISGHWVWDATITLQDRSLRTYYQSDRGSTLLRFSGLKPGRWDLSITAPHYADQIVPVRLRRGRNVLADPIQMVGLLIPDLSHFIVIEDVEAGELEFEIRPVSKAGPAVTNHPSLDIWVGCLISAQIKNGRYVDREEDTGSERGETILGVKLDWVWDPAPETNFRYTATLPLGSIRTQAPYWVVDYLVAVPNPEAIDAQELDEIMSSVMDLGDPEAVTAYLDQYTDRLSYFLPPASWNVKGGPR